MRFFEFLVERISSRVFHYTRVNAALKIVQSGQFELTHVLGSGWEERYAPRGYPYFLSTTRTRLGGYHGYVGQDAVLLELDGEFYNQHYPGRAVDYWGNRNPTQSHHKDHEAEDRIFSRESQMPAAIKAIDIYVADNADGRSKDKARKLIITAKQKNIPMNLFNDPSAWRQRDTRNLSSITKLTGQDSSRGYVPTRKGGYLRPWMELLQAKTKDQLSSAAEKKRYALMFNYDRQELTRSLSVDLSNARKPGPDPDRNNAVRIIQFMRQNKLDSLDDLIKFLTDKWKTTTENMQENFADGKKPGRKGLAKRSGVNCKQSVSKLRNIAKSSSGERKRMAHWCANMKSGRSKK
jgi:hypothetical protein